MRRNVKNKKVLRAITIGLAAVLSVTSTPLPVFAAEGDNVGSNNESTSQSQGETTDPVTVDSALDDADKAATTAEGYTGTLNDEATPATGTGTVGTSVANALNTVTSGEAAVTAGNDLYKAAGEVGGVVDNLLSDGKPSSNGVAQIKKAETLEGKAESKFGVELNADGTVKNQDGLDNKVSDANGAIGDANNAKQDAYNALAGKDGVQDKVNTANGLITTAEGKKSTADADTTAANEAIEDKTTGKDALENATQEKLKSIETTLNAAVVEKDIAQAVSAAVGASTDALRIVNDNLEIADKAYQQAKDAADDAVTNTSSYNRQQMINLATAAQNAANNAKAAATAADKAMEALDTQETAAKTALTNAQTALTTSQNEAIKVLKDYKSGLDAINAKITTANGSRSEAQEAMKAANEAIDAAILLMGDTTDTSVTGAQAKIKAMNEAIETANEAIEKVTGLMYASGATKDEKKAHFFGDAEETCKNAQIRLTGNGSNFIDQTKKLADAKKAYDKVIDAKGEVAANKDAADAAVKEIDKLINGEGNIYDKYIADVDKDINDLKALLSTGGQYSYSYFEDTAERLNTGLSQSSDDLVAANKSLGGSEEDQNLTADQIVAKYNKAVSDNETLEPQISAKMQIISDCDANEGSVKSEYDNAYGEFASDISALNKKYVYSFNEETQQYEITTDKDGKPVHTDDYKKLVGRSQATNSEYKCGDEVLAPTVTPDYTDAAGSKYVKAETGTVTATSRPNLVLGEDNYRIAGGPGIDFSPVYDNEKGKFVQTIGYSYDKDMTVGEDIGKDNKKYSQTFNTKPEDALAEILPTHLSNVLNAQLTKADIKIDKENYTIKIELDSDNASRLGKEQHEDYVLYYNMQGAKLKEDKKTGEWTWSCSNIKLTVQEGSSYFGRFTETTEFDAKKYDLTVSPTADALIAQGEKKIIDTDAETAKEQINNHKKTSDEKLKALESLRTDRAKAADDLYGYYKGGSKDNPLAGSLLEKKDKNDTIISALGSTVSEYNTVLYCKGIADANLKAVTEFDITKATGISEEDKAKYNSAVEARGRVVTAKANANGYLTELTTVLGTLDTNILSSKNGVAKYEEVNGKVVTAQGRLTTVRKKLDTLKSLQQAAVGNLTTTSVDDNITVGDKTVAILNLNNTLETTIKGFKKYNLDDYNALAFVRPELREIDVTIKSEDATTADEKKNVELLNMDYLGKVRETLFAAINSATEIIERENGNLSEIAGAREILSGQLEKLNKFATDAQTEADRAARALANWRAPESPDNGGDEDEDSSSSYAYTGINTNLNLNVLPLTAGGAGVGARTVTRTQGVLGARDTSPLANIQNNAVPLANGATSNNAESTVTTDGQDTTSNIENNMVPLAATPYEEGAQMNLLWLLGAAAAAGAGAYAFDKHRRKVAANDESKKYKK